MGLVLKPHSVEGNSEILDVILQQKQRVEWAGMFLQGFLISKNQISLLYLHRVHWVHLGAHNAASVSPLRTLPIFSEWCILCFVYSSIEPWREEKVLIQVVKWLQQKAKDGSAELWEKITRLRWVKSHGTDLFLCENRVCAVCHSSLSHYSLC